MSLSQGTQIHNQAYTIIRHVRTAECYEVYAGRDNRTGRDVFIYILLDSLEGYADQLIMKARAYTCIHTPYLAEVIEAFSDGRLTAVIGEYAEGMTLKQYADTRPLPEAAKDLTGKLALAINEIHHAGQTHLNLHPDNIIIAAGTGEPMILGFSLPIPMMDNETARNPYAAPERYQLTGRNNPAHDIYSLGAILYTLLLGKTPPLAEQIAAEGLQYPDNIDYDAADTIDKAMEPKASNRFLSGRELADALHGKFAASSSILSYKNAPIPDDVTTVRTLPMPEAAKKQEAPKTEPEPAKAVSEPAKGPERIEEPEAPEKTAKAKTEPETSKAPVQIQDKKQVSESEHTEGPKPIKEVEAVKVESEPIKNDEPVRKPEPAPKDPEVRKPEPVEKNLPVKDKSDTEKKPDTEKSPEEKDSTQTEDRASGLHKYWIAGIVAVGIIAGVIYMLLPSDKDTSTEPEPVPPVLSDTIPDGDKPQEVITEVTDKEMTVGTTKLIYTGSVNADGLPDGKGKCTYPSGLWKSYDGDWKDGMWDGEGRLIYTNGDVYRGGFKQNAYTTGIYSVGADINDKGDYFKGDFNNGTPWNGAWYHADGTEFQIVENGIYKKK